MSDYLQKCDKLYQIVEKFIDSNDIYCAETIFQTDRVIEGAYDFIYELCNVMGYKDVEDEDD